MTEFDHPQGSASPMNEEWDDLMTEFRGLGGIAENVVLGRGSFGRGLFPHDPTKPFLLRLPDNLLFPVQDVEFVDNRIRLSDSAGIAAAERHFFDRYQSTFSWGGGGEAECRAFIAKLDSLPPDIRALLIKNFRMDDLLEGDQAERARKKFLHSRMIYWNKRSVLMPLIELANCGIEGVVYDADPEGRLQIEGKTGGEILVNYGLHDPFDIFRSFGFPSARPRVYSLPMRSKVGGRPLRIGWNTIAKTKRGNVWMPEIKSEGAEIVLSHLVIGNANGPRLPRSVFRALMKEAGATGADEGFDRVLFANKQRFLDLLGALEPHRGEMVTLLRAMAHFQLEAMTNCVGSREL